MENNVMLSILSGSASTSLGPTAHEILMKQAEQEYQNGERLHSVFYQVRALFQTFQQRLFKAMVRAQCIKEPLRDEQHIKNIVENLNEWEQNDIKNNPLLSSGLAYLQTGGNKLQLQPTTLSCDFLQNVQDAKVGMQLISDVCQALPKEWTVLQLCKGARNETTHCKFSEIHVHSAAIYITVLKHARSGEYPLPVCCCIEKSELLDELFRKQGSIAHMFKQHINVDPKSCSTREQRMNFWSMLDDFDKLIAQAVELMKRLLQPWGFLFLGQTQHNAADVELYKKCAFAQVDAFCQAHAVNSNDAHMLLSLAALHVTNLSNADLRAISEKLFASAQQQEAALQLLIKQKTIALETLHLEKSECNKQLSYYPCILIVDERLDHFFWEEMNVQQGYTRVGSLQCLIRLHSTYKHRIKNGYLQVNTNNGVCILNPDKNLPKTEMRVKSFLEYWIPNWSIKTGEQPKQEDLFKDYFKRDCFVYAGHGSGLQYINGKYIARQRIECVTFLFGCDSTRLHSCGLYSELVGPHMFYQAALCPTLVGTLMPSLDSFTDIVTADILSHWIKPPNQQLLCWDRINSTSWTRQGIIKESTSNQTASSKEIANYNIGSLCDVLSHVHQRQNQKKYYNTVQFICRGLPAWNCNIIRD